MKVTCSKTYPDLPFSHRQHRHDGHCRFVHGHNWTAVLEFEAARLDENGFVIDFGKLRPVREWLEKMFDHTTVLSADDPLLPMFSKDQVGGEGCGIYDLRVVPDCSCEGLAVLILEGAGKLVHGMTGGRVSVAKVTLWEDSKNCATAEAAK